MPTHGEQAVGDQHDRQDGGQHDEEVADPHDRLLEVRGVAVAGHEFGGAPKNVFSPVAVTTAVISPCLTIEPEKASSPTALPTGNDSPVSDA